MEIQLEEENNEQINSKEELVSRIYSRIKKYIEKDDFDLLQFKSKNRLDRSISSLDKKIEKLMSQNSRAKEYIETIRKKVEDLNTRNQNKIESLRESIR